MPRQRLTTDRSQEKLIARVRNINAAELPTDLAEIYG